MDLVLSVIIIVVVILVYKLLTMRIDLGQAPRLAAQMFDDIDNLHARRELSPHSPPMRDVTPRESDVRSRVVGTPSLEVARELHESQIRLQQARDALARIRGQ